jgi:transposase
VSRFDETSGQILASVQAGCSIDEAARSAGVSVPSVRRWLTAGRKGFETYAEFAQAVDAARSAQRVDLDCAMTHGEAEAIVIAAMRRGSLQAVRLWLEMNPRDGATEDELSWLDQA